MRKPLAPLLHLAFLHRYEPHEECCDIFLGVYSTRAKAIAAIKRYWKRGHLPEHTRTECVADARGRYHTGASHIKEEYYHILARRLDTDLPMEGYI